MLLMVYLQTLNAGVSVRVMVEGKTSPEAPAITEELLTTAAIAAIYGQTWLDDNRYPTRRISLSAPHDVAAVPGSVISIIDGIEGILGTAEVGKRTISIKGPAVIDTMEVRQCL
jgi:hypothetical protein